MAVLLLLGSFAASPAFAVAIFDAYAWDYNNGTGPDVDHAMTLGKTVDPLLNAGFYSNDDYSFLGSGVFTEFDDGTATLTGTLVNRENSDFTWEVSLLLLDRMDHPYLPPEGAKTVGGSPDASWRYYVPYSGMLTGTGILTGSILNIAGYDDGNPNFQVGDGANDKDGDLGASAWMWYSSDTGIYVDGILEINSFTNLRGDFNMDLVSVPEPGTLALLGAGLLGLAFARRRRKA